MKTGKSIKKSPVGASDRARQIFALIIISYLEGAANIRMKEIPVNPKTQKFEIDIMEKSAFAVVVCDGVAKVTEFPVHGGTKIVTHQGKVKRVKFDEGGEF